MRILVSGATGLIGRALGSFLGTKGNEILALKRSRTSDAPSPCWNWEQEIFNLGKAAPVDALIHLAGENVGQRWTAERKAQIYYSRINGTRFLIHSMLQLPKPPRVILSASAVGIYGDRGSEWLEESSEPGRGFLAGICREWEAQTSPAAEAGIRVAQLRFGVVLSPAGGALARMLPVFRLGLGGKVGDGEQYWSWITIVDLVQAVEFILNTHQLSGPVNVVSPQPSTNLEFTKSLGAVLGRPAFWGIPKPVISLLLGEMGRETLLSSARVRPSQLLEKGFKFQHPELKTALYHLLGKR